MIKIFTTNQNGKIEFTKQELLDFIKEIEQECKKERHQATPVNPAVSPIWTTPYFAVEQADSSSEIGARKMNKNDVFNELLKELGCQ